MACQGPSCAHLFSRRRRSLHECPDATVDICFVHGLTGNRNSTWTAHGQSTPWPKTLLPPEFSRARILTYGYDAYIVRKSVAGSNCLIDHATNFLNDLTTDRPATMHNHVPSFSLPTVWAVLFARKPFCSHETTLKLTLGAYSIALKASSSWGPRIKDPGWQTGQESLPGLLVW